jgi:hypothetical protein
VPIEIHCAVVGETRGSSSLGHAAEVTHWGDSVLRLAGLAAPERQPDHVCAANTVEVEVFAPERIE